MYLYAENPYTVQVNEQQSWQLISQGDKKVFEQVFNTYYQLLCNYACSMLKDIDEAEEVVQNMFFNIWNKRESLQVNTSIKSYMYRATHNDCLNKIKHGKVRTVYAQDYKSSTSIQDHDSAQVLQAKELGNTINRAIDTLPEQCGLVFKLSRFENLKYQEIADRLNISVKTVENHMGKALKILRTELKDYLHLIIYLFLLS
ncbi:MAG: RNA polymerase sigma-70 factor [Bacteroidia bacterium]|nr:RNA polymerase sigma-70 factor [Bacteroidia bacterium]